jgi:pimeloyl-ACP methyl ester carboxylesterase
MGSLVAQRVAIDAPGRVERLVLAASMTTAHNITGANELRHAIEALGGEVPEDFAREFQEGTVYRPLPKEFMDGVVRESLKLPTRVWRKVFEGLLADEHTSRLGRIKAPTLLLWGERDALLSRAEQISLVGAIPGAVLKVYTETGHSPQWERPEQFTNDLEAFIT